MHRMLGNIQARPDVMHHLTDALTSQPKPVATISAAGACPPGDQDPAPAGRPAQRPARSGARPAPQRAAAPALLDPTQRPH